VRQEGAFGDAQTGTGEFGGGQGGQGRVALELQELALKRFVFQGEVVFRQGFGQEH